MKPPSKSRWVHKMRSGCRFLSAASRLGENIHFTPCFPTCSLAGFWKEMLKQDVFKDAFGQMGIYLHKLFKYLFKLHLLQKWVAYF